MLVDSVYLLLTYFAQFCVWELWWLIWFLPDDGEPQKDHWDCSGLGLKVVGITFRAFLPFPFKLLLQFLMNLGGTASSGWFQLIHEICADNNIKAIRKLICRRSLIQQSIFTQAVQHRRVTHIPPTDFGRNRFNVSKALAEIGIFTWIDFLVMVELLFAVLILLPSCELDCCQGQSTGGTEGTGNLPPPVVGDVCPSAMAAPGSYCSCLFHWLHQGTCSALLHAGYTAMVEEERKNNYQKISTTDLKAENKFLVGGWNTWAPANECNKNLLLSPSCLKRLFKRTITLAI